MKKINYKLIVSDFDGTLLTSEQTIPQSVRTAINEYVSSGGIFAVCTGRMLRSILPRVRELGLKGLVVAYQGTVIAEIESGKILKFGGMDVKGAAEVCRFVEKSGYGLNIYADEVLYTDIPEDNKSLKLYEEIVGVRAERVNAKLSEFISTENLVCQKIACLVAPEQREGLYGVLQKQFGQNFDVTCSAQVLVEVSPITDNKGEALQYLAGHFNIPLSSTVAVGDNLNDLSMIKKANIGVAVGNAVQGLKDAANFISVTNNNGAVAQIIEKFGFI